MQSNSECASYFGGGTQFCFFAYDAMQLGNNNSNDNTHIHLGTHQIV